MESQRLGHNWSNLAHTYAWKSWQQVIFWKYKPDQRTPLSRLSSGSLCHWGSQNSYNGLWGQIPSHPWYLSDFISHCFPSFTPHVGLFFFLESPKHMPASECLQLVVLLAWHAQCLDSHMACSWVFFRCLLKYCLITNHTSITLCKRVSSLGIFKREGTNTYDWFMAETNTIL